MSTLDPQIVVKPEMTFIGMQTAFIHALSPDANNTEMIGTLWCRFLPVADSVTNRIGNDMFGLIFQEPESSRSHKHELQYIAAVQADSQPTVPEGMVCRKIPSIRFAVFTHRGSMDAIGETVGKIYREWLPASGFQQADVDDIEHYDQRFCPESAESEMEYWIPLQESQSS